MQQHLDVGAVVAEAVLLIADVAHHIARHLGNQLAVHHGLTAVLAHVRVLRPAFARDDDLVGSGQRLAA
jgi:hypothetical protein